MIILDSAGSGILETLGPKYIYEHSRSSINGPKRAGYVMLSRHRRHESGFKPLMQIMKGRNIGWKK
ncbi:hypothetical protein [Bacillus sp. T33-2]|uniref:hypothetical protein n=1 Tax=Bacillus sp. T33-2 TaxID=2054168 RepID=UPI000C7839A5|nr:hypothetical protein [Bacillus sp. T33-2]PLR99906.1 hypothetical protein CVD19_02310 [Bacillus sp. T33-2]